MQQQPEVRALGGKPFWGRKRARQRRYDKTDIKETRKEVRGKTKEKRKTQAIMKKNSREISVKQKER